MSQKFIPLVLTLVTLNKKHYAQCNLYIKNFFNERNIKLIKSKKLSKLVIDYYFNCDFEDQLLMKKSVSHLISKADILIQEIKYRRKKIIACDMDMTVINKETLNLISENLLTSNKINQITEKAMNGEISFRESIISRTMMLKGLKEKDIINLIKKIKINSGVKSVIRTMNYFGYHTILISGGYDIFANTLGKKIGFKEVQSNSLEIKNNVLTGNLKKTILDKKQKLYHLKNSMQLLNIPKNMSIAVGDGDNDTEMISFAGLGVAWRAYPKVREIADVSINLDFKSILYFQGYEDKDIKNKIN